ncbi:MAG: Cdc6/Cdc18 family protein [Methanosarcinaceae archaeon]
MSDLKDIKQLISENTEIIKSIPKKTEDKLISNEEVFSSNYLPYNIFYRDNEIETLVKRFIPTRLGKYCADLSIYGPTGTGKTLITKMIFKSLSDGVDNTFYVFIPCNEYTTPVSILKYISQQIYINNKGRGVSDFYQRIKNVIKDKLLVLIFDEVDVFLQKEKSYQNLIQVFSDWNNCVLVFISNNPSWHEYITDHRTISRLHLSNMIIKPYGIDEIFEIIHDRALKGLKPGAISDDMLMEIAKFTAQYSGDARVAIKILSNAASYADEKGFDIISHFYIEKAIDSIEEDNQFYFIESLSPQLKLILVSVYQASRNFTHPDLDAIYNEYKILVTGSKTWKILSQNTVRIYLDELETYQLIQKNIGKGRGRGKGRESTKINLTFDKEKFKEKIIMKMIKQDIPTAETPPLSSY